jgi:NAD(P)-dependent dehydrogenase (short-subunit alcohol dehydrogenase family)
MQDKICLVTGATAGIGEVTALELARKGAHLVFVGRNPQKCQQTLDRIQQATTNPNVEFLVADLSSMQQVRLLAAQFKDRYPRLDVLVNNAGGFFLHRTLSVDGLEMTFALNHLSYFLLTLSLLDLLKASAPSRIVNVASGSHFRKHLNFDDLQTSRHFYNGYRIYGESKLANLLFTYELSRRLVSAGVTANALHPGLVSTNIWNHLDGWMKPLVQPVLRRIALTPEQGAQTVIYLASSPQVQSVTGKYFVDCQPVPSSPASYDKDAARYLWDQSLEYVKRFM